MPLDLARTRIDFDVRVPMHDGVTLSADVYRPAAAGPYPVLLYRTPYNKNDSDIPPVATYFAGRGFVVVYVDVRGCGDSDGVFVPYRSDGRDGFDAVEGCAAQHRPVEHVKRLPPGARHPPGDRVERVPEV